ncbi:MSC_0624 family F1-like ATPase-associated membrane protein [Mycoplasma sp. 332]|uniref:MSC_0624 family F1-like ATPase-associated membrane protein n=1 Tax=Mycoplasma sp. 332 TaxID=3458236 RepID=UPI0040363014
MQNSTVKENRIYDDFESLFNNKRKNLLVSILKITIISLFIFLSGLILFFAPITIFSTKLFAPFTNTPEYFLNFSSLSLERINYLAIFRISLLISIFLYTISKNFSNIFTHKESAKKYIPWFVIYSTLSIISVILLFTMFNEKTLSYYYLSFLSVILLIVDVAYAIYTYKLKKKTNPLFYKNKKTLIISIISRSILVIGFMATISAWIFTIEKDEQKFDFLDNNPVHQFFISLFSQKSGINLFYLILIFVTLGVLIFGINIERILWTASKQQKNNESRERLLLYIGFAFTTVIWFIRALFYKTSSNVIDAEKPSRNYIYLIGLIFIVLFFISYVLVSFLKPLKIKGVLLNTIFTGFIFTLIWIITAIVSLKNQEIIVTNITLLFSSIFSIIILMLYKYRTSNEPIYVSIILKSLVLLVIFTLIINGLNALLLSNNNQSFYNIPSKLSLDQIFVITTLSFAVLFNISTVINLIWTLTVITKKNNVINQGVSNEVK